MHRQPPREPPGDDSSIWPEELPYAVGQLERLGPRWPERTPSAPWLTCCSQIEAAW